MTTPRRAFGPQPRGRLAGTMLRVLAAELSDPARFTRAKSYVRDGAVIDIDIARGVVRAEVRGSRFEPYVAELHVGPAPRDELEAIAPGRAAGTELLVPERRELVTWCSCPDDSRVCKHTVAALLVLADEVTIDPEQLVQWRSGAGARAHRATGAPPRRRDHPLAELLQAPSGIAPPTPTVRVLGPVAIDPRQADLDDLLTSALAAMRRRRGSPRRGRAVADRSPRPPT